MYTKGMVLAQKLRRYRWKERIGGEVDGQEGKWTGRPGPLNLKSL